MPGHQNGSVHENGSVHAACSWSPSVVKRTGGNRHALCGFFRPGESWQSGDVLGARYASRDGFRRIRLRQKVRSTCQTPAGPIVGGAEDREADSESSCKRSLMVSRRAGSKNGFEFKLAPPPPPRTMWRAITLAISVSARSRTPSLEAGRRKPDLAGPPRTERHETRIVDTFGFHCMIHIILFGTERYHPSKRLSR